MPANGLGNKDNAGCEHCNLEMEIEGIPKTMKREMENSVSSVERGPPGYSKYKTNTRLRSWIIQSKKKKKR